MTMRFGEALQNIADVCVSAGLDAAVDARDLTIPGVWVTPGTISFNTMSRNSASMDVDLYLVSPDHGATAAYDNLGDMLDQLVDVLYVSEAIPVGLNLPNHGADSFPALHISLNIQITKGEEPTQ